MTKLMNRAKKTIDDIEITEQASELRTRIMDAVEEAIDRLEGVVADAPSASEAGSRLKNSAAVNAASTFVVASIPTAVSVLRNRTARRSATRVAKMTPWVVRTHPVLLGTALLGSATIGFALARRKARKRHEAEQVEQHAVVLGEQRMDNEGPMPGIDLGGESRPNGRRFVRSS